MQNNITIASLEKLLYYDDFSNGRNIIYRQTMAAIDAHPLLGNGLFADRVFSTYSHNMVLEILLNYGYLLGIVIIVCIFGLLFKQLYSLKRMNSNKKMLLLLIVSFCAHGKLMVSGSYIVEPMLYFTLGLLCTNNRFEEENNEI